MSEQEAPAPVLDFEQISVHRSASDIDKAAWTDIGQQMKKALQEFGFFYAKNHGISWELVNSLMAAFRDFFEEPEESKKRHIRGAKGELGWIGMELERSHPDFPPDLKESFNYHPTDDRNCFLKADCNDQSKTLYSLFCELSYRVTDALAKALGFDEKRLREPYQNLGQKGNQSFLRTMVYPPITSHRKLKPGQVRLAEHTDYGMLTLLFQDDVGGLEMNTPSNGYVSVTPIPETILVFVGYQMQRFTADVLIAPKHKIMIPVSEEKARKCRQSLSFAVRADDNFVIKCLDGSNKYESVCASDHLGQMQMAVIV